MMPGWFLCYFLIKRKHLTKLARLITDLIRQHRHEMKRGLGNFFFVIYLNVMRASQIMFDWIIKALFLCCLLLYSLALKVTIYPTLITKKKNNKLFNYSCRNTNTIKARKRRFSILDYLLYFVYFVYNFFICKIKGIGKQRY